MTMKKLMMMTIGLIATMSASAQVDAGDWAITPRVGIGIADLTGKLYDPDKAAGSYDATLHPITSFVAGIEAEYGMTDQLSLAFGMAFSTQGAKTTDGLFKVAMDYLNVPVTVQFYPIPKCGLAIKAGAQFSFLTRKKITIDGRTYDADYHKVLLRNRWGGYNVTYVETEVSKQFNKFDFSIPIGISYELYHFVLDARYNLGLTKVMKDDPEASKHSVWQFTLGYKFDLGD